eukprot:CAMPEP_0118688092 /NCGR_PEP_ID=MMETSP0800-20121206/8735_1 /TAXON_ID=210618 ORGANISM="Striatella unipunctata, Strain CCMP2910" /NCGR_SAMPLE_ID=MMETSP0800 /ASSEMBLY_ACC=CAM_ASM_000638 /LENGTH=339 /DNA_ID=CAMNT_0006585327 /DNA_START=393 /DNA_END=1409 /DNA_ORIENTATION=-
MKISEVYNALIKAHRRSKTPRPDQAEALFRYMLRSFRETGNERIKPDAKSWAQVMKVYAQEGGRENTKRVIEIFDEVTEAYENGEEDWKPDANIYGALIKSYGCDGRHSYREKALRLLGEMIERYQAGEKHLRPNVGCFIHAIQAQQRATNGAETAEVLLNMLEEFAVGENADLKPSKRLYNLVLRLMSWCDDQEKAIRADKLLNKMIEMGKTDSACKPDVNSYNTVLNTCAFFPTNTDKAILTINLQIAVARIKELCSSDTVKPDDNSYASFIRCCSRLIPTGAKRDAVVGSMFKRACDSGLVSGHVLSSYRMAASRQLFEETLGTGDTHSVVIPYEW